MTADRWCYVFFWFWFAAVAGSTAWVYCEVAEVVPDAMKHIPGIGGAYNEIKCTWLAWPIKVIVGILVCWRMIKVLVLHGWPFPLWYRNETGRDAKSGRVVTGTCIGDADDFLFGAIFRAHPTSDKIVRSRLELLVIRLPRRLVLSIREGRFYFRKFGTEGAAHEYQSVMHAYIG